MPSTSTRRHFLCVHILLIFVFINKFRLTSQNQAPYFYPQLESTYFFAEYNATKPGDTLMQLSAEDSDDDDLEFGVMGDFYNKLLEVKKTSSKSASVILKQIFDREVQEKYENIVFYVRDPPGNQILQTVRFVITDIDDNAPVFTNQPYKIDVSENQTTNSVVFDAVLASDLDGPLYNEIYFSLTGEHSDKFTIETQPTPYGYYKGIVRLEKELDYETEKLYLIKVLANDGLHSTSAELTINVLDSPDMPPVFSQSPYYVKIAEEIPVNEPFFMVHAHDGDVGINNKCVYEILYNNSASKYFQINEQTGELSIRQRVDRESNEISQLGDLLEFTIIAKELHADEGDAQLTESSINTAHITVAIIDINDNDPIFEAPFYNLTIIPKAVDGTVLTINNEKSINVNDLDKGINGSFSLTIHKIIDSSNGNLVYLENSDTDYEVFPKIALNYANLNIKVKNSTSVNSKMGSTENYLLQAKDNGVNGRVTYVELFIKIESINEQAPKFGKDLYIFYLDENSPFNTTVGFVTARDDDLTHSELFGTVYYELKNGQTRFNIDSRTGQVFTISQNENIDLDRETIDTFYLSVDAVDGGGLRTSAKIIVKLNDLNDNTPKFLFSLQQLSGLIEENSIKWLENVNLLATDQDLGLNALVTYEVVGGDFYELFDVDVNLNRIILKQNRTLDFERLCRDSVNTTHAAVADEIQLKLIVQARDFGTPTLTAQTSVKITVKDVNDNSPIFQYKEYRVRLLETDTFGDVVQVNATDADAPNTSNSRINYRILSGSREKFVIDSATGLIRIAKNAQLDRDTYGSNYTLRILATDYGATTTNTNGQERDGNEDDTSVCQVFIDIVDVNNKKPQFESQIKYVKLSEDMTVGTPIVQLRATDTDTNAELVYTLVDPFSQRFAIQAYDKNRQTTVNSSLVENWFGVDKHNGTVYVNTPLDRELAQFIDLTVFVEDLNADEPFKPQVSTAILKIELLDVNDNYPKFENAKMQVSNENGSWPQYELLIKIPENLDLGTNVFTLHATDADKDQNVTYTIDNGDYLTISRFTGDLYLSKLIDYEAKKWINVTVFASDNGRPAVKQAVLKLNCKIVDLNDNMPIFTQISSNNIHLDHHNGQYFNATIRIKADSKIGDELFQVHAVDADSGLNSDIYYYFDELYFNDNDWKDFYINSQNGRIYLNSKINREHKATYMLNIIASDRGHATQQKVHLIVQILIVDKFNNSAIFYKKQICLSRNDVKCAFNYESIVIDVFEEQKQLFVRDLNFAQITDSQKTNDDICYYMSGGDMEFFDFYKKTGALYSKRKFDYETRRSYEILIRATENCTCERQIGGDNGTIVFCEDVNNGTEQLYDSKNDLSRIRVRINILDVNDNTPFFTRNFYKTAITPDVGYGDVVLEGNAIDLDLTDQLRFEINESSLIQTVGKSVSQPTGCPFTIETHNDPTTRLLLNSTHNNYTTTRFRIRTQAYFEPQTSFKFKINVYDGLDSAHMASVQVNILILNKKQRIRFLSSQTIDSFRGNENEFKNAINSLTGLTTNIDSIVMHRRRDTTAGGAPRRYYSSENEPKTDILTHFTNPNDTAQLVIIPAVSVLKVLADLKSLNFSRKFQLVSAEQYDNSDMFINFLSELRGNTHEFNNTIEYLDSGELDDSQYSLVKLVLFIICCSFLLIIVCLLIVCFLMRRSYQHKLEIERNLYKAFDHKHLYTFDNLAYMGTGDQLNKSTGSPTQGSAMFGSCQFKKSLKNLNLNESNGQTKKISEFYLKSMLMDTTTTTTTTEKFNCLSFTAQSSEKLLNRGNEKENENFNIKENGGIVTSTTSSPVSNLKNTTAGSAVEDAKSDSFIDKDCADLYLLESTMI